MHPNSRQHRPRPLAPIARRLAVVLVAACSIALPAQARNVALLVGVAQYGQPRWNLEGPVNDVNALRDVLQRRWGFAPADVRTLTDQQATKANILAELRALLTRSAPGDDVLIYLSGHGSSALDGKLDLPVPHGSGAFVPYGIQVVEQRVDVQQLIVGRTDLLPLLQALDEGGRKVWVVSDSCYSGNQVRSVTREDSTELPVRAIPLLVKAEDMERRSRDEARATGRPTAPPFPYRNTAFLAASAEGEVARDIPRAFLPRTPTITGKPQGAMTDALLRVLEGQVPADFNGDGRLDLNEVHRAVGDFMAQRAYGHSPQRLPAVMEDRQGLGSRSVLAATGVAARPTQQSAQPLRVRLGNGLPPTVTPALRALPDTQLAGEGQADVMLRSFLNQWQLLSASGDLLAVFEPAQLAQVQQQLEQLAWAHRFRQVAERHRRGALASEIHPAEFGGNLRIGQTIHFAVRPDRDAWLVLVNIDAKGQVSVLYPSGPAELQLLKGGEAHAIPGSAPHQMIKVQPPEGMDMQFVLAFDSRPAGLEGLIGVTEVRPSDRRLMALEAMLAQNSGRFTFAQSHLRVAAAKP